MTIERHGLSIGIERHDNEFFVTFTAVGKLTHADYKTITPMLDNALAAVSKPSIKALFDARELEGWEPRAAWDDLKLDLKHGRKFDKIALVGHARWQELAAKVGSWFISGEMRYFEDSIEALEWLFD